MKNCSQHVLVVEKLAESVAMRLCGKVRRHLQGLQEGYVMSDDDSGLRDIWDEFCVQVQGDRSLYWPVYLHHVEFCFESMLKDLEQYEIDALWLSTEKGDDWLWEDPKEREPFYPYEDDIINLLVNYLYTYAGTWSTSRIIEYIFR